MGIRSRHQTAAPPNRTGAPAAVRTASSDRPKSEPKQKDDDSAMRDLPSVPVGRAPLMDRLRQCLIRAARHGDYRFAVLALDVDRLKVINETLGRVAGDELLAGV